MDGGSTVNVGNDFHLNKDGGRNAFVDLGSGTGGNSLNVANNLNLDILDDAINSIELEINNASSVDIDGDLQFNTNNDGQLLVDINSVSELLIAGAIDRAINGSEFGRIESEATATITYDGTAAQIMEEEAGGGADFISYGRYSKNK